MRWAEPDVHDAARYLKRLREDPDYYRQIAENGQQYIRENLSVGQCAEKMKKRVAEILAEGKP